MNPVRSGVVEEPVKYKWSSASWYYRTAAVDFIDTQFVLEQFGAKINFIKALKNYAKNQLEEKRSRFGSILGSENILRKAERLFNRRKEDVNILNKRLDDKHFEPVAKVIYEFEKRIGKKIDEIDTSCFEGKKERSDFLLMLKDYSGLKYSEIFEFEIFRDIKFNSLGNIYSAAKKRFISGRKKRIEFINKFTALLLWKSQEYGKS